MKSSEHPERAIHARVVLDADMDQVWRAWTTNQGVRSFFAPDSNIDLRLDGPYEIFFNPDAEPGERGAEGMRIMALQPPTMLAFTWNAPPSIPALRQQRTHVIVRLKQTPDGGTEVRLTHDGWGEGIEWDRAFEYFDRAWNQVVFPRLEYRFRHGPVDWLNPPDLSAG
jgi:uncharacterized protein YndB with AHSA1/START domain